MPWDETTRMTQRLKFVFALESCQYTMSELCDRFGISRKTGYKWAERYVREGPGGLVDRSRAPLSSPQRMSSEASQELVKLRRRFPGWGPHKLKAFLEGQRPELKVPAASTIGDLLKREGLVEPRRPRRRHLPPQAPRVEAVAANDVWSSDFKGQFRLGDGGLCYPLTVSDGYSRYLLGCEGLESPSGQASRQVFERLFREYGLPRAILTDNGSPFAAARSLARLSRLSVWWIKLGIRPVLTQPGHPEQNGRHERMHRTLKAETARPPGADAGQQQERFDQFRRVYNEQRPHQALGQTTPAALYEPSTRPYPSRLEPWQYPGHFEVRTVRTAGEIKWQGELLYVSDALAGEQIGLEEVEEDQWAVYFGEVLIARFDGQERKLYG